MSAHREHHRRPLISFLGVVALLVLGGLVVYSAQVMTGAPAPNRAAAAPVGGASIHEAVARGDVAAIKREALAGADLNAPNPEAEGPKAGMTPLIAACYEGNAETVRALLESNAKVEARGEDGRTALIYAAGWGDAARVQALLDAKANVNARANDGWTALMFAAARGEVDSVRALVRAGANVDERNKWRQTALMHAARSGSIEKVAALLESGAGAGLDDMNGDTALSIAAGSEVDPAILTALVGAGAPVNHADQDGVTALMKAAERGDAAQVKALLAARADASIKDKANGWTARDWALKRDDDKGRAVGELLK